jgi:hypothetical protein
MHNIRSVLQIITHAAVSSEILTNFKSRLFSYDHFMGSLIPHISHNLRGHEFCPFSQTEKKIFLKKIYIKHFQHPDC